MFYSTLPYISKFDETLRQTDFSELSDENSPNEAYDKLMDKYNSILNKIIPEKTSKFDKYKHNFNPWVTKGIRLSIKHRDKLHSKIKKSKTESERNRKEKEYNEYRSFLNRIIKNAKRKFEKERFRKCKNDSKSIWANINSLLGKSNNKKDITMEMNDENGIKLSNLKDIANGFNR